MDEDKGSERATRALNKAIDALLGEGPKPTGVGILLGYLIYSLVQASLPTLKTHSIFNKIDIGLIPIYAHIALGAMLSNLAMWVVRKFESPIPESVKKDLAVIDKVKREGGLKNEEVKQRYLDVIDKHLLQTDSQRENKQLVSTKKKSIGKDKKAVAED